MSKSDDYYSGTALISLVFGGTQKRTGMDMAHVRANNLFTKWLNKEGNKVAIVGESPRGAWEGMHLKFYYSGRRAS